MNLSFKNLFNGGKKKEVVTGGYEILQKLIASDISDKGFLEQYSKSLYVFACISKIAEKTASIELEVYKILNSKGDIKEMDVHPALDLLYRCNPYQTRAEFWETTLINLKCTGDAYWYKIRNKGGRVVELWNLRPDMVSITPDDTTFIKNYKFSKSDGTEVLIATEDIVHFKYPDPLSTYLGMSPLKAASKRVQTEDYATTYQRDFFLNSARPDAVIKNPNTDLNDDQKKDIKEGWDKRFRGVGNSSKVAILEGGLDYQLISISQKEMDYIESLKFTRDDILAVFKVPKPIIAITEDVNYANAKTAMSIFLSETIKPEISRMVEKINEELIIPDFGDEFYLDFVDPTTENRTDELAEYANGIQNKWLLINEVRAMEGLPPVKGGWSFYGSALDVPIGGLEQNKSILKLGAPTKEKAFERIPVEKVKRYSFKKNMILKQKFEIREMIEKSIVEQTQKSKKAKSKTGKKKAVGRSFIIGEEMRSAWAGMINKKIDTRAVGLKNAVNDFMAQQKERVISKFKEINKISPVEYEKNIKAITVEIGQLFDMESETVLGIQFITPFLTDFLKQAGIETMDQIAPAETFNQTDKISKLIAKRAKEYAVSVNNTTIEKLSSTLAQGIEEGDGIRDLSNRIEDTYGEFSTYRSELIARTEATTANNLGMVEAFKQSGVANAKEWINAGDSRVRDEHQDGIGVGGEIVELDSKFSNGLGFPQEPNCRCVLGPAFIEK